MLSWKNEAEHPTWIYPKLDPEKESNIIQKFKIHPVSAKILVARDFDEKDQIHKYLYAKLPDLYDPYLLGEMQLAVDRICHAIDHKENILIYGDNDVDGMTGTALLTDYLRFIGANVFYYVSTPGTMRESLIVEALEYANKNRCRLIITVDCGVTSASEVAKIVDAGVDVIVTDHHEPTGTIPHCIATLNPKLLNSPYPNRDLTGVGVAFKLAHAITHHLTNEGRAIAKKIDLKPYLDLVALGTIADMGKLLDENRILVRYGIQVLKKTKRIGLAKLINICEMKSNQINTFTIASKIAPRLNSLGRIADPQKGVELLLLHNAEAAEKMAVELDLNNIERQRIERTMSEDVDQMILEQPEILNERAIIMQSDKWHPGVIAILSTRIAKHYNRPTIMIAIDKEIGKGSLRSIHEFPLLSALKECSDLLINFGGHDFAAGLTIKTSHIEEFKKRFIAIANNQLDDHDVMTKLQLDSEIQFEDLTFDLMESIRLLEPFGNENPAPVLYTKAEQAWPPKIIGKNHLKLYLRQGDRMLEGMAFGKAHLAQQLRRKGLNLKVAFTPQINNILGPSIQLLIRDIKILEH